MKEIKCAKCGKELLSEKPVSGDVFFLHPSQDSSYILDMRIVCKKCSNDYIDQIKEWELSMTTDELFWYSNPKIWEERFIDIVKQYLNKDITDDALVKMKDLFVATFPFVCKEGKETWTDEIEKLFIVLLEKKESKEKVSSFLEKIIEDYKKVSRMPTEDEIIIANGFN